MRPQIRERASVGNSTPIILDRNQRDFKVGLQLEFVDGATATAEAQSTLDDPHGDYPTSFSADANWFDIAGVTGSADAQGNLNFPAQAVRLKLSAHTSGTVKLTVIQAND